MNKILYIARRSKGFTEAQLAQVLGMPETEYIELECELRQMPLDIALKAAKLFHLTPDYFLVSEKQSAKLRASVANESLALLSSPNLDHVPAQLGARFIALGTRALVLQEELNAALHENQVLRRENEVLRQLNTALRPQQEDNPIS